MAVLTDCLCSAFGCGPLSLAALAGDIKRMELLLENYPNAINELNLLKQTPLHLAVGHPPCTALLLRESNRKLIDLSDGDGRRPMEYTVFSCCGTISGENQRHDGYLAGRGDTSLSLLLDAGCMIPNISSWSFDDYYYMNRTKYNDCLRAVSAHLIDRREDLKRLAANNLPRMQATALGVFSPFLLDSKATLVNQALKERRIPVPTSLQVYESGGIERDDDLSSAYHKCGRRQPSIPFPFLWSLGFRDFDMPNIHGITPLMSSCVGDARALLPCS